MKEIENNNYIAINWNQVEDMVDKLTWEKLTEQFWLDTRIPLSNDLDDWRTLSVSEKDMIGKVFGGLTLLDTLQSEDAIERLRQSTLTQHEEAVLNNIQFMEGVHAKSYSSIFSTLNTKSEIESIFNWTNSNEILQYKAKKINEVYKNGTDLQAKAASVLLESFLFYSGFFAPLYYLGNNKLANVAEIIKLIIRDECLTEDHCLLTPNGWVSISQVTKDTLIAQYNVDTNSISFAYPINISSHFEQNPVEFRTQQGHINFACSPNHRVLTFNKNGKSKVTFAKDFKANMTRRIKNVAVIQNENVKYRELSVEERLLIAINADGNYDKTKNSNGEYRRSGEKTGTVPVKFSFTKERKIERLRELAKEADWKLTDVGKLDDRERLYMTLYVPVTYANVDKPLPSKPLNEVSLQWCKEYIDEIAKWDGHIVKGNPSRITWGTVRPDDAKLVQTIASLAGYRVHYSVKEDNRSETFSDYHRLQIHTKLDWTGTGSIVKKELEPQMVYGVEVPSSFLLTKRGDSVSITGNSVHGTYIGYKFQLGYDKLPEAEQEELKAWVYQLTYDLYQNETKFTQMIYDEIGWTEKVKTFIRYNANKALQNLGFDPLFPDTADDVDPIVMNGISTGTSNHDFFSQVGNGYLLGTVEAMEDEDYLF